MRSRYLCPNIIPIFGKFRYPPEFFDQLTTEDHLYYEPPSDKWTQARQVKRQQVLNQIRQIISDELTGRQNDCVQLYFYEGKTQEEIGDILGISRRVVSQHLFGVTRNGKKIGGAINKIRKMCRKLGIQYP